MKYRHIIWFPGWERQQVPEEPVDQNDQGINQVNENSYWKNPWSVLIRMLLIIQFDCSTAKVRAILNKAHLLVCSSSQTSPFLRDDRYALT